MRKVRPFFISLLILIMLLVSSLTSFAGNNSGNLDLKQELSPIILSTAEYLMKAVPDPGIATIGGEWTILGLARSQKYVPQSYYEQYYSNIVSELVAKNGHLTSTKYTEYSRVILALTAMGKDVTNVGGYNLLEKLADFNHVKKQGINGPIYALIALDSKAYNIPEVKGVTVQTTRQMLVDYILNKEVVDADGFRGGFSLSGDRADADITGMALQALSNYQSQSKVKEAINRALKALESIEQGDGEYLTWGGQTSESIIQVIIAKSALGIDPAKNVSALMDYYVASNGFRHILDGEPDLMATEQGLYALAAYDRYLHGQNALYNMMDSGGIKVSLNGEYLRFDQAPVNIDGRVLVPMRIIFESMGADVIWDGTQQKVTASLGGKKIELIIGNKTAYVNDTASNLDVPARILNGRTLVPVRFVSESLNADVTWEQGTKSVVINKR